MKRQEHIIDATDKVFGRLAVEIALLLRGKEKPNFLPNQDLGDIVIIKNVEKVKFSGNKMTDKKYYHHTGYAKGLREVSLRKLFAQDPAEVLRRAVHGMLPNNKLSSEQIKRLKFQ